MKTIRYNVFETNSSSTHSLIICTDDEFEKWKNGGCFYNTDTQKFEFTTDEDLLTEENLKDAENSYKSKQSIFMKSWDELSDAVKAEYIRSYLYAYGSNDNMLTYKDYQKDLEDALTVSTATYITEHGDKIRVLSWVKDD